MKTRFVLPLALAFLWPAASSLAAGPAKASKARPAPVEAAAPAPAAAVAEPQPPKAPAPTGPAGMGELKVGMPTEAVEALTSGDVYLTEPMAPKKMSSNPDGTWMSSRLSSPLTKEPAKLTLVFKEGVLSYFSVDLEDAALADAEKQLTAKYGPPKVAESNTEEQCLYKNGANFKLPNRIRNATWKSGPDSSEHVVTSITVTEMGICPSNLRYGGLTSFTSKSLSFSLAKPKAAEEPKKSVF